MTRTNSVASLVHDAIDDVTTAVEGIHQSVADFPLEILGEITPLRRALDEVRDAQTRTIGAVYSLIRKVNGEVRRRTTASSPR